MALQTSVSAKQGAGVPGEFFLANAFSRAQSFILNSVSAAYNIIGATACSLTSEGKAAAGNVGGTHIFAGILANPKVQPSLGTQSGGSLAPTMTLPNYAQVELVTVGSLWVTLPAAAAIGDLVVYDNTTGALSTIAPGADLPVGKSFAYAAVDYYTVTAAGLAVITLSPTLTVPQLA